MQNDWYEDSFIEELKKIFKPKLITNLQGISDGYLLKYDDHYLKIYPDEDNADFFFVEYYRYDQTVTSPLRKEYVTSKDLKKVAELYS